MCQPDVGRQAAPRVPRCACCPIHADVDHGHLDLDKVREIGGYAVGSGTPGNGQVYVDLADAITVPQHSALCRALGAYLGGADSESPTQ